MSRFVALNGHREEWYAERVARFRVDSRHNPPRAAIGDSVTSPASWLRCYRCWSQNLEVQVHYEGILKVDPDSGEAGDPTDEVQEAVVQCLECLHDQPHLHLALYEEGRRRLARIEAVEDRWERMVLGSPWVAS